MTKKTSTRYAPEVRERAVRMVEHQGDHGSQWAAIRARSRRRSAARRRRCAGGVRQAERDSGLRAGTTSEERDRIKTLEREGPGTAAGERDPPQGLRLFCDGGARPPIQVVKSFIDEHCDAYGVEPICFPACVSHRGAERPRPPHLRRRRKPHRRLFRGRLRAFAERRLGRRAGAVGGTGVGR